MTALTARLGISITPVLRSHVQPGPDPGELERGRETYGIFRSRAEPYGSSLDAETLGPGRRARRRRVRARPGGGLVLSAVAVRCVALDLIRPQSARPFHLPPLQHSSAAELGLLEREGRAHLDGE